MKLVVVEWVDITSHSNNIPVEDAIKEEPSFAKSVGWLFSKTKKYIKLSPMVFSDGSVGERQTIPRGCITNMRVIE